MAKERENKEVEESLLKADDMATEDLKGQLSDSSFLLSMFRV